MGDDIIQTFLPYASFELSAKCLDYRRLGKQRVEARQIIDLLEKHDRGINISVLPWGNHPAVRMWMGYTDRLREYYNAIVLEWTNRGYKNSMPIFTNTDRSAPYPPWLGRKDFHDAHKSNLLRKDKEYYSKYKWKVSDDLPYKWR